MATKIIKMNKITNDATYLREGEINLNDVTTSIGVWLGTGATYSKGDEMWFVNDFDIDDFISLPGNIPIDATKDFIIMNMWFNVASDNSIRVAEGRTGNILYANIMDETKKWATNKGSVMKFVLGDIGSDGRIDIDSFSYADHLPFSVSINGKIVKSISIGNKVKDLTIGGSKFSFSSDIAVTQADIEQHIKDHITWDTPIEFTLRDNEYERMIEVNSSSLVVLSYPFTGPLVVYNKSLITFKNDITVNASPGWFYLNDDVKGKSAAAIYTMSGSFSAKKGETWLFEKDKAPIKVTLPYNIVADIDTTAKLKGLSVTYSKSTGITDGEKITATVAHDSSVSDTINGGTVDVVYTDIDIVNPARKITEQEVETYVKANLADTGNLDVTKWPALHPGTKLHTPNLHITKGDDIVYTVQADHGFTINGGAKVDYTINIPITTTTDDVFKRISQYIVDNAKKYIPSVSGSTSIINLINSPVLSDDDYNLLSKKTGSVSCGMKVAFISHASTFTGHGTIKVENSGSISIEFTSGSVDYVICFVKKTGSSDNTEGKPYISASDPTVISFDANSIS